LVTDIRVIVSNNTQQRAVILSTSSNKLIYSIIYCTWFQIMDSISRRN